MDTAELETTSVRDSIGSIGLSAPPVSPQYSSGTRYGSLLDSKLSYFGSLSARFSEGERSLLEPPPAVLESALTALQLGVGKSGKAGSLSIIFTVWNTMMGSTLLVMPFAFDQAGWLLATALCALAATISYVSSSITLAAGQEIMRSPSAEYGDLASNYFGREAWLVVLGASVLVVVGAATAMHGYMSNAAQQIFSQPVEEGGLGVGTLPQETKMMAVLLAALVSPPHRPDLGHAAPRRSLLRARPFVPLPALSARAIPLRPAPAPAPRARPRPRRWPMLLRRFSACVVAFPIAVVQQRPLAWSARPPP